MFLLVLISLFNFSLIFADGFKNIEEQYFYKVPCTITIEDWSPAISDNFWVGVSFNGSSTFTAITDTLSWGDNRPSSVSINYIPEQINDSVVFGIFINTDGIWSDIPIQTFDTKFINTTGVFTEIPNEIFNDGIYTLTAAFNKIELPNTISLQFSDDGGYNWKQLNMLPVSDTIKWNFINNFLTGDVIFRYVYNNTLIVIAQSDIIPVKERNTYFRFKTYGGQKNLNDMVQIAWEKSLNFESVNIEIYLNDSLISNIPYQTDDLYFNFNNYGNWKIHGIAESIGFKIEQYIEFIVNDPCQGLKEENQLFKDSIFILNKNIDSLHGEILLKDTMMYNFLSIILNQQDTINQLKMYIKDSTVYNLIYRDEDITEIKDSKNSIDIGEMFCNKDELLFNEKYDGSIHIWLFDIKGNLIYNWYFLSVPNSIKVEDLVTGSYYVWILNNAEYKLYKFIKT